MDNKLYIVKTTTEFTGSHTWYTDRDVAKDAYLTIFEALAPDSRVQLYVADLSDVFDYFVDDLSMTAEGFSLENCLDYGIAMMADSSLVK